MKKDVYNKLYMKGSDTLWEELDLELARNSSEINRLKKHDRSMRDKAHEFNKKCLILEEELRQLKIKHAEF